MPLFTGPFRKINKILLDRRNETATGSTSSKFIVVDCALTGIVGRTTAAKTLLTINGDPGRVTYEFWVFDEQLRRAHGVKSAEPPVGQLVVMVADDVLEGFPTGNG